MRTFTLILCGAVIGWNVMAAYRRVKLDDARADDNALVALIAMFILCWII